jgi:hypothetical protein
MITFAVVSVLSIFVLAGGYFCYVCSQSDLIVIKSPNSEFTIDCSRWFKRSDSPEETSSERKMDR